MFKVLFTAVGRRVELIKAFQISLKSNGIPAMIIGVDSNPDMAAAGYFADKVFKIPRVNDCDYIETLLHLCRNEQINLLIPLFEPEFLLLNNRRNEFTDIGTILLLSAKNVLDTCCDKWKTYQFFQQNDICTPLTWLAGNQPTGLSFPQFGKPRTGMGSIGAQKVSSQEHIEFFTKAPSEYIFQEFINGTEYTIDVLADFNGRVISVIPRERLEVRAGEVSKSRTVYRPDLVQQGGFISEMLGIIGVANIQCIDDGNHVYWTEINPRFGGGVPLSIRAGVDYPYLLYRICRGETVKPILGQYWANLTMLRYDEAIYF